MIHIDNASVQCVVSIVAKNVRVASIGSTLTIKSGISESKYCHGVKQPLGFCLCLQKTCLLSEKL